MPPDEKVSRRAIQDYASLRHFVHRAIISLHFATIDASTIPYYPSLVELIHSKIRAIILYCETYFRTSLSLFNFISIEQVNTGITSGQLIPSFTSLPNDAVGIFSSRITTRTTESSFLDSPAIDSLRFSFLTSSLNFN